MSVLGLIIVEDRGVSCNTGSLMYIYGCRDEGENGDGEEGSERFA